MKKFCSVSAALVLVSASSAYAQQTQTQHATVTSSRTINYGYLHNQIALIEQFQSQAPAEYAKVWNYIIYKLDLEEDAEFEDVKGLAGREARIILVHAALDYFANFGE
ncbi:hypothetical protein [Moraxella catarrhalis]|uniref:hypothetical protein n=1 Tax=Moraxella catarrhalis TaxID=480 RepID=UPI00128D519E|nr:hypothetical protein [Moraxella catarrhalis]MPX68932.1 hypothetical protein [Moraxella catarrhalis]MPX85637.1 hypothetical protein [Moraxella catarrhalis]